jgi:hypothetical protein
MKKSVVIFILSLLSLPQVRAQYWDWVTDEKSMNAFTSNYTAQLLKMYEWLGYYKVIQMQQDTIAAKVTFIHMVRDSLFKSLQDVSHIDNSEDEKLIRDVFNEINMYYNAIQQQTEKYSEFQETWENYRKFVSDHSRDLLAMADMATGGHDEKNLLDKNQRLYLLACVLKEMRGLKAVSQETHQMLHVAIKGREALQQLNK